MTQELITGICLGYLASENKLADFSKNVKTVVENSIPEPETLDETHNVWYDIYDVKDELFQLAYDGLPLTENSFISAGINSSGDLLKILMAHIVLNNYYDI